MNKKKFNILNGSSVFILVVFPLDGALQEGFSKLPEDENRQDVKKNIPGIPVRGVPADYLSEEPAELIVTQGRPTYKPIPGTTLLFVDNTESDIFLNAAEGKHDYTVAGRWFRAQNLRGPWQVCSSVPPEIYTIPASHPTHDDTYDSVYDSTPDKVTVGYTSGYSGADGAATDVLMFGLGYLLANEIHDDHWHDYYYHYGPHYWGYGCAAHFNCYNDGCIRAASYYAPYGETGRAAVADALEELAAVAGMQEYIRLIQEVPAPEVALFYQRRIQLAA